MSSASRIPNFAGVALVDILANGVAVLVIVIVLSIAARSEKEERYSEKVQEIGAVMTREFSSSLVLNRLAASPPAQLHDYEHSDIDRIWNFYVMPVIEFHRNAVRDPYSGTVWTRKELLQRPNDLDDFLVNFTPHQRRQIRGDIYDVGTYYLLMSIMREHGIRIWHWHFIGGTGGGNASNLGDCPPGLSYEDCLSRGAGSGRDPMLDMAELSEIFGTGDSETDGLSWPPEDIEDCPPGMDCSGSASDLNIPDGSALGLGVPNQSNDPSALGSFPDARQSAPRGPATQSGSQRGSGSPNENAFQLRLADPSVEATDPGISPSFTDMRQLLAGLMLYLRDLQESLDKNQPPTELLDDFLLVIGENMERTSELSPSEDAIVNDLFDSLELAGRIASDAPTFSPIPITISPTEGIEYAYLKFLPNRLLLEVEAIVDVRNPPEGFDLVTPKLSLNRFPDIWRGLQITLNQGSVVLAPPTSNAESIPHWRAVAHLSSSMDDMVVGFVYTSVDEDGYFSALADSNRVRIDGYPITVQADIAFFGVKTWLVIFYCGLAAALISLLLFWRPGMRKTE